MPSMNGGGGWRMKEEPVNGICICYRYHRCSAACRTLPLVAVRALGLNCCNFLVLLVATLHESWKPSCVVYSWSAVVVAEAVPGQRGKIADDGTFVLYCNMSNRQMMHEGIFYLLWSKHTTQHTTLKPPPPPRTIMRCRRTQLNAGFP